MPATGEHLNQSPAIGPSLPPPDAEGLSEADHESGDDPLSYSDTRAAIRSLTMPPIPNFNIPPSPPGSPPPDVSRKFSNFLELKRKGVHFNSKLESSAALRNPGLLQKLMEFAGINDYDQYATPFPEDLAVPTAFPPWAYGDQLNKTQQAILKKSENEKRMHTRDRINFVSASTSTSASSSAAAFKPGKGGGQSSKNKTSDHSARNRRL
jgi:hypothetical protein